jgi:hypothetical protein
MSCVGTANCTCGCCSGTSVQTPQLEINPPGLTAIAYRAGTWASFKESMLARLSSSDYPALAGLKSRDDDDFTIAFVDATAIMLDILTFYQERLANESYLRTARQLRSLIELSRLIGYQPAPGVSAITYLAFTLKAAPGQAPDPSTSAITIPQGSQVQSVPAQGQKPQTFETSAPIQAKADWNALAVQAAQPWIPPGASDIYLAGTSTQLKLGDALLILGVDRERWSSSNSVPSEQWEIVILNRVEVDKVRNLTYVAWSGPLLHETSGNLPGWTSARVFAFRQKAALFGNNAPDPNLFVSQPPSSPPVTSLPNLITAFAWNGYTIPSKSQIDLDASYPKIVVGSWFALTSKITRSPIFEVSAFELTEVSLAAPLAQSSLAKQSFVDLAESISIFGSAPIYTSQLFKVTRATTVSLAKFGLSGKVTELIPDFLDPNILADFPLNSTGVLAQSDELAVAPQPLDYPLYGSILDLADLRPDLVGAAVVGLFGNRQKIAVADKITNLVFAPIDGSPSLTLNPGDVVTVADPSPLPLKQGAVPDWNSTAALADPLIVEDASSRPGTIQTTLGTPPSLNNFTLVLSGSSDPEVSEYAMVASVNSVTQPYPHTQLTLKNSLANCYDRNTTTVNANVGPATHGQSVTDVLGSGSASTPNQTFTLRQSPLTFVQAPTPTGRQSTLQVVANGAPWTEVPSLYNQSPSAQVFATLNQYDGTTDILGGDGVEGATFPTGTNNLQANYRIGSGSAGNVASGALTTLMDRPLGVSGVTNPEAATGGQDPQSIDGIRTNAPQTVLTLGRAVSITDYQNFAATFAGIAKAYAIWIPNGPGRGVFLTVAGVDGVALPPGNGTLNNLVTSLQNYGNPLVPITAVTFLETLFGFSADLAYRPGSDIPTVKANVLQALYRTYSFANRDFGKGVSVDEISAVIQAVPGVVAVNVTKLYAVATSQAGDLTGQAGGVTPASLNKWLSQPVSLPRPYMTPLTRICAYLPVPDTQSLPLAAEILVLDPDPKQVYLGTMS